MPRINLLPWREQQRTERKKAFGVGMLAAGLAAAAVAFAGWLLFNQMISSQQTRNAKLRDEIKVLDKQIEEINSLETQKQQFIARMDIIEKLQRSRPEIVHVFDTFVKTIPDGAYLTAITQNGQSFKIQGVAQSPTRVSWLMQNLDQSEWLMESEVEKIESAKGNAAGSDFTLNVKQRTSLASEEDAAKSTKSTKSATDKRKKS